MENIIENILENIAKLRKEKGLSYESMANELGLSIAAYRKIELNQTNLTVDRLYQIAKALEVNVARLLDIEKESYHQTITDQATGYQKIENIYQENKETYEKLVTALQLTINLQQKRIEDLEKRQSV